MTLHDKLVAIQSSLKAPKGQRNSFGNYNYRSCEDILEAVKPLLKEHGLIMLLSDEIVEVGGRVYVKATAAVSSGALQPDGINAIRISTSAFARESEDKKGMDAAQITGAASSYARKYALNGLFCIDDTKDADATNDHGKNEKAAPPKREDSNKAHTGEVMEIDKLCTDTGTDKKKLYEWAGVIGEVPTKDQSAKMLASLKKKLSAQLDKAA